LERGSFSQTGQAFARRALAVQFFMLTTHRSLIFEVHFQELEVYFVKNKGLPRLFLAQYGQMTML
jgi:hypothetical protein